MGNILHPKKNRGIIMSPSARKDSDTKGSLPQSIMEILLVLVNGEVHKLFIDSLLLVGEFKSIIFQQISQTLLPKSMVLCFNKQQLDDHQVIGRIVFDGGLLRQKKAPLTQISRVWVKPDVEDQITLEKGVAVMSCGHLMGRSALIEFMKATISQNKFQLLCPFEGCHKQWSYDLCRKVGNFTKEEDRQFSQKLTRNWMAVQAKNCPGCGYPIEIERGTCNRVSCCNPKCKYGQFCKLCFKEWANHTQNQCGNTQCFYSQFFINQVGTMTMEVYEGAQSTVKVKVEVPTHRLCPSCRCPIEHNQGCKHMSCPFCQHSFCWICLEVFKTRWRCGAYNQYCGFVASNQTG